MYHALALPDGMVSLGCVSSASFKWTWHVQVDYDRNAAKRTSVIDDQSDFFEIDSNAWLSDEVRLCS